MIGLFVYVSHTQEGVPGWKTWVNCELAPVYTSLIRLFQVPESKVHELAAAAIPRHGVSMAETGSCDRRMHNGSGRSRPDMVDWDCLYRDSLVRSQCQSAPFGVSCT